MDPPDTLAQFSPVETHMSLPGSLTTHSRETCCTNEPGGSVDEGWASEPEGPLRSH